MSEPSKTLGEWLADYDFTPETKSDEKLQMWLDVKVTKEHTSINLESEADVQAFYQSIPFKHKNIHCWVELENGKAVGFNENPAIGWSFPHTKYPK